VNKELMHDAVNKAGKKYYLKTQMRLHVFLRKDDVLTKLNKKWGVEGRRV